MHMVRQFAAKVSVPLSRSVTHLGDRMCSLRLEFSALSPRVDKLASCDTLVIACIGEIRSVIPVVRLLNLISRSWVHTELVYSIIREGY
jgi:hypothetical protein